MTDRTIYDELGVPTVINAVGTKTRISGTLMRGEAADAMREASRAFVRISDLQQRASELIAEATGAQAGYVTSGASAALSMAAAACLAGDDLSVMARLPDTEGIPNEIVMPRTHRNGYDHALRLPGAKIVDVGANDYTVGTGSRNVEPWEVEAAISEQTVAVAYTAKPRTQPPLERVCEVAHAYDVPVIVDAAAQLPPATNLERYIEQGADLVAFSGGKAIRGPQSTGILAGSTRLIRSVARQHIDMHAAEAAWDPPAELLASDELPGVPRQGIGRSMKVGKEEVVGLIRALELFIEEDHEATLQRWNDRTEWVATALAETSGLKAHIEGGDKIGSISQAVVTVDPARTGMTATALVRALRAETPRVFVGADRLDDDVFTVNPMCLSDDEAEYVVERVREHLS